MSPATPVERFWPKVQKTATCWLWTAQVNSKGYGCFSVNGQLFYAHRFAWVVTYGPIPLRRYVLHRCDTPACVNPAHLFLGTQADNMQDCKQKGRTCDYTGARHPQARLTEADVVAIRADARSHTQIARQYGITRGYVNNLKHRRCWAHLP